MRKTIVWTFALSIVGCGSGDSMMSPDSTGGGPSGSSTSPQVVQVMVLDNRYEPRSVTIQPGQTVRWIMQGSDPTHTSTARNGAWDSGFAFQQEGGTFERSFGTEDDGKTFEYSCTTHADCCDMKGSVRVGQSAPRPSPGY